MRGSREPLRRTRINHGRRGKSMKKREFLRAGAVSAAAVAAGAGGGAGGGGGPLMDMGAKAFAERLEFFSGGRMKIQVFVGGALGNALKVSETVKNGVAGGGHTGVGD